MEAFVAIMFLLGFSIYMIQVQTPRVDISEEIGRQARYIVKAAAHDNEVRNAVMGNNTCVIKNFVYQQLKQYAPYLDYYVKLCAPGMSCQMPYAKKQEIKKDIYADDYLFSANLTVFRPTVMKIFLWESETGPSKPGTAERYFYTPTNYEGDLPPSPLPTLPCRAGRKLKCDGESYVVENEKIPQDENTYEACKYDDNIDEDCDGLISCFGGVPKDLTKRDDSCYGKPVAKNTDPTSVYGTCNVAECLCLLTEGPAGSIACQDGFDNDGNGVWDDADPNC